MLPSSMPVQTGPSRRRVRFTLFALLVALAAAPSGVPLRSQDFDFAAVPKITVTASLTNRGAVGNLNGDAYMDVVDVATVANGTDQSVLLIVNLGKPDGSFEPPRRTPLGAWPTVLTIVDMNLDGLGDLLIGGAGPAAGGQIEIVNGRTLAMGQVIFNAATRTSNADLGILKTPRPPVSLALGRLNDDTTPDAVVASEGGVHVLGSGPNSFVATSAGGFVTNQAGVMTYQLSRDPFWADSDTTGMLNGTPAVAIGPTTIGGDADNDVFIGTTRGVEIFENNQSTAGAGPFSLVSILNRTVGVRPNGASNIPNVPANSGLTRRRAGVIAGDVTGDGRSDVISIDPADGTVWTFVATPAGYAPARQSLAGQNPVNLGLMNFDNDGKPDLFVAFRSQPTAGVAGFLQVLQGLGDGAFNLRRTFFIPPQRSIAISQFSGASPTDDIAVTTANGQFVVSTEFQTTLQSDARTPQSGNAPGLAALCADCTATPTAAALSGSDAAAIGLGLAGLCADCTVTPTAAAPSGGDAAAIGLGLAAACADCTATPTAAAAPSGDAIAMGTSLATLCSDCTSTPTALATGDANSDVFLGGTGNATIDPYSSSAYTGPALSAGNQFIDLVTQPQLLYGSMTGLRPGDRDEDGQLRIIIVERRTIPKKGAAPSGRGAITRLPAVMASMGLTPPRVGFAFQQRGSAPAQPAVRAFLTSLGGSTGDNVRIQVLNDGPEDITLAGDGLIVEPLKKNVQQQVQRQLAQVAGSNPVTATLSAYCAEFLKQLPSAGVVYRVSDAATQQRMAPLRQVLQAAVRLEGQGLLKPDGGNPREYFHSIRQWALWSKERGFNEKSYGDAFVENTKKNAAAGGVKWTDQIEKTVRSLVPHRWSDISQILQATASR